MDDEPRPAADRSRSAADKLGGIEGTDAGALGTEPPPQSAPEAAEVDDADTSIPGPDFGDHVATADKPWFTSLAAESDQAGVGNDPPDAQEPEFPTDDEDPR